MRALIAIGPAGPAEELTAVPNSAHRPVEGEPITLLLESHGTPAAYRAKAGRVGDNTLLVPLSAGVPLPVAPGDVLTVVFQSRGRLLFSPMLVEEVLPSSCFLVAAGAAAQRERRSFARAQVRVWAALWPADAPRPALRPALLDVSAAGVCAVMAEPLTPGLAVQLALAEGADGDLAVAGGRVVRCVQVVDGYELGVVFHELSSDVEDRLQRLVAHQREQALMERLGRRRLM